MRMLYFAWIRDRIGLSEETVNPPAGVSDVAALMQWLADRTPGHRAAFADAGAVKAAVNQTHAQLSAPISAGDEIAFFPPVTGG